MDNFLANFAAVTARYGDDGPLLFRAAARRREYPLRYGGKICKQCERDLPLSAFSKDSQTRDDLRGYCRECDCAKYLHRRNAKAATEA